MTQRKLFPEKMFAKLERRMRIQASGDEVFSFILIYATLFCFLVGSFAWYADEIGWRISMKPHLLRWQSNLEGHYDTTYTRSILLKYNADSMVRDMDKAYEWLCRELDYGKPSYDRFYDYEYLEVE